MSVPVDGFFTQRTVLGPASYILTFRYNTRMDRWVLDIATSVGVPIVTGRVIQGRWPVLSRFVGRYDGLPLGALIAVDMTGQNRDPQENTLGGDVILAYYQP